MDNSNQKPCQCQRALCECADVVAAGCECGDSCGCQPVCNCAGGRGCANTK
jgi:hypothetical protein